MVFYSFLAKKHAKIRQKIFFKKNQKKVAKNVTFLK